LARKTIRVKVENRESSSQANLGVIKLTAENRKRLSFSKSEGFVHGMKFISIIRAWQKMKKNYYFNDMKIKIICTQHHV
jgi:hypothetical protein